MGTGSYRSVADGSQIQGVDRAGLCGSGHRRRDGGPAQPDVPVYYPIVSHANYSLFGPKVFVDVSAFVKQKRAALEAHQSQVQRGRIPFQT